MLVFILAVTVAIRTEFSCLTHRLPAMPTYKRSSPSLQVQRFSFGITHSAFMLR